jgi:hypothetical protein
MLAADIGLSFTSHGVGTDEQLLLGDYSNADMAVVLSL